MRLDLSKKQVLFLGFIIMIGGVAQVAAFFLIFFNIDLMLGVQQHILASALLAMCYKQFLPRHYRLEVLRVTLMLWVFFVFFPVVGIVGIFVSLLLPSYSVKNEQEGEGMVTAAPILPENMDFDWQKGSLKRDDSMVEKKRLLMKMASQRVVSKESIEVIRKEMSNPVDEVRLLAYSLLDKKSKQFNDRISRLLQLLDEVSEVDRVNLYERLAFDYWGLVSLGLAQGDVLEYLLDMSNKYAELAIRKELGQERAELFVLLAKISLRKEDKIMAAEYLTYAENKGVPREHLLVYWAEEAFISDRIDGMSKHLNHLNMKSAPGVVQDLNSKSLIVYV